MNYARISMKPSHKPLILRAYQPDATLEQSVHNLQWHRKNQALGHTTSLVETMGQPANDSEQNSEPERRITAHTIKASLVDLMMAALDAHTAPIAVNDLNKPLL